MSTVSHESSSSDSGSVEIANDEIVSCSRNEDPASESEESIPINYDRAPLVEHGKILRVLEI